MLVFSDVKQPVGILNGFLKFCKDHSLKHKVIPSIKGRDLSENEIYFVLDDKNLIRVVKKIKEQQFLIAKNVGIVSLNDTILKEVVANGINTISTNFNFMGQTLAEMILNNNKGSLENPSNYIKRNSL